MSNRSLASRSRLSLNGTIAFFAVCGVLLALLSLAPGAPLPIWIPLRIVAAFFILAALGLGARRSWGFTAGIVAAGSGLLASLLLLVIAPSFVVAGPLAGFAFLLLGGSGFALYSFLKEIRDGRNMVRITSFRSASLVWLALVVVVVFGGFPLLGSVLWSLYGCNGTVTDVLCL